MSFITGLAQRGAASTFVDVTVVATATLLVTLSARVSVPFYPVPMTLQTFAIIGLGFALGPWRAAATVLLYLAEGAVGLPVFAGTPEKGIGLAYMLGPTGGYLVGYVPAAALAGWAGRRDWGSKPLAASAAGLVAGAVIYVPGLLWLGAVIGFDKPVLQYGLYPFIPGDVAKAVLAALLFIAGRAALEEGGRT
ncbi:biotin transporter BioY [Mesorhizobium sp.]|uniref:biotin transporter BioY n=1 Tax=Mesorhizobium sp. TaxID=1871066 RepID=UPI000FE99883|nr:biotin transporter BioY [Mesorhizobium sp.]RWB69899.1 MAG: biotin transporter BioY [Mesorhizobium sp.]